MFAEVENGNTVVVELNDGRTAIGVYEMQPAMCCLHEQVMAEDGVGLCWILLAVEVKAVRWRKREAGKLCQEECEVLKY